jgi:hypothetical protein
MAYTHKSKVPIARIDNDAFQIGPVRFRAIQPDAGAGDHEPRPNKLLGERIIMLRHGWS